MTNQTPPPPVQTDVGNYDPAAFSYDVNAPMLAAEEGQAMPERAAGDDAMMTSFITSPNPDTTEALRVQKELIQTGLSDIVEKTREAGADRDDTDVIKQGLGAIAEGTASVDEVGAYLKTLQPKQLADVDYAREVYMARLNMSKARTADELHNVREQYRVLIDNGYPVKEAIQDRLDIIKANMDETATSIVGGILADALIPNATTSQFAKAFNQTFPEDPLQLKDMPRGKLQAEVQRRFEAMDSQERFTMANTFIDFIADNDNVFTGQDFQKWIILEEAFGEGLFGEGAGTVKTTKTRQMIKKDMR